MPYDVFAKYLPDNPHVTFFESRQRGYVSVELTRDAMTAKFQAVSDVTDADASLSRSRPSWSRTASPGRLPPDAVHASIAAWRMMRAGR